MQKGVVLAMQGRVLHRICLLVYYPRTCGGGFFSGTHGAGVLRGNLAVQLKYAFNGLLAVCGSV